MLQHCRRFINHNLCDLVSIYRWRVHMQVWSVNCAQLADFITYDTLETVNIKQLDTNHYKPVPTNLVKNSKEATVSTQAIGKHCLWWQKTSLPIKILKKEEEKKSYHVSKQRTGNCYKIHTMAIENKFPSFTIPTRKISKNHSSQSLVICKLCTWKVNLFDFCCQWTGQARGVQMTAECELGWMTGWPVSLKCLHCLTSSTQ